EAEAGAKNAAACRFQDRRLNARVLQHRAGALRATAITRIDTASADEDALGTGHTDTAMTATDDVSDEPRCRRLAVDAGHCHDRDAATLRIGKQRRDDRLSGAVSRFAEMQAQSRIIGHAHDDTALLLQRSTDVLSDNIDTAHVEPNRPRHIDRAAGDLGM